jgi:hypothetical protein
MNAELKQALREQQIFLRKLYKDISEADLGEGPQLNMPEVMRKIKARHNKLLEEIKQLK